jgi:hypothetical protein
LGGIPGEHEHREDRCYSTVELHLSGLFGTGQTEMRNFRIIGLLFEIWLHWQVEVEKKIPQTAV